MVTALKLQMNDALPLREAVFTTLLEAIMDGTLPPGERLMEIPIAKQLGVSRTPVREAVRKLEKEGLVRIVERRGAVVSRLGRQELEDVLEVRSALEELAARSACRRMTGEMLARLERAGERFKEEVKRGSDTAAARSDEAFHDVISAASGNRHLLALLEDIRSQVRRCRLEAVKNSGRRPELVREHDRIVQALRDRDEEAAARAVREHIARQREALTGEERRPDRTC